MTLETALALMAAGQNITNLKTKVQLPLQIEDKNHALAALERINKSAREHATSPIWARIEAIVPEPRNY